MGKDIATNAIGGDLYSAIHLIFDDENLASSGDTVSREFMLAQTIGGSQVNIVSGGLGVTTGVGETLVISIATSPTSGGTFDNVVFTKTIPASKTFTDGQLIASFLPPRELAEVYTKITITSDFDATGQQVRAYQVGVANK